MSAQNNYESEDFEMPRKNAPQNPTFIVPIPTPRGNLPMSAVIFEEVTERPTIARHRAKQENPFSSVVADLAKTGKTLKFEAPFTNEADEKNLRITLRLLSEAGNEVDRTVRRQIEYRKGDKPVNGNVATVVFWTVEKIRQNRKG